ncbi:MAG: hypothetical protein OHK0023_10900 [Anaerolineae bacterium]
MIVQGKKIYLRAIREADLDELFAYSSDLESYGNFILIEIISEVALRQKFSQTGFLTEDDGILLFCDVESHAIYGMVEYFRATPYFDGYELAYRIYNRIGNSGRGLTSEAVVLASYLMFSMRRINRMEIKVDVNHAASRRVAEKAGYVFEGVARKAFYLRGTHRDMAIYSMLRDEAPQTHQEALARIPD